MAVSDSGAKIAASRLGVTVAEYREHEANGERWCPKCGSWQPANGRQAYCRPCWADYCRPRSSGGRIAYAGPDYSGGRS